MSSEFLEIDVFKLQKMYGRNDEFFEKQKIKKLMN